MNTEKPATSPFFISSNDQQTTSAENKKYQSIIKKYRKQDTTGIAISSPSSSIPNHETSSNNFNQ
ncbi:unnamed protein product, partial [Rotaria magnacalcarata]